MKNAFSLVEIILSVAIFALVASLFIFLIIESYKINEKAQDIALATFLAEEGIEAVRSVRDANFSELKAGTYKLVIENNRWVLKTGEERIGKFTRQIIISSIDRDRRKIVSLVSWQPRSGARREVRLFSRITNWTK